MMEIPDYDWRKDEAIRLKAVFDGSADPAMQRQAILHAVEVLGGINKIGLDPTNTHMTAFNAGRRWVARQIQIAITTPLDKLVKEEPHDHRTRVATATERANSAAAGRSAATRR